MTHRFPVIAALIIFMEMLPVSHDYHQMFLLKGHVFPDASSLTGNTVYGIRDLCTSRGVGFGGTETLGNRLMNLLYMFLLIELCTIKIVCHSIAYLRSEITFTSQ
jgi:hypothetical protein